MARFLVFAFGLAGATGLSQFPEFSQQYTQRLAGAVDELTVVVDGFDADARSLDLTREDALLQMEDEGDMASVRAEAMRSIFTRQERLSGDLEALRNTSSVERALQAWRFTDSDVAQKAWVDFKPAVPVTAEGLGFAGAGFIVGWLGAALLFGVFRVLFSRRRQAA